MGSETKRLTDKDMTKIAGGFIETFGFAMGNDIKCSNPLCNASEKEQFSVTLNLETGMNDYVCLKCGATFSSY